MIDTPEDFGPAMMALDERARKWVVLRIHHGENPSQAAKKAGYSEKTDGYLRVQGHRLSRQPRVIAAMREEAEKRMGAASAMALVGLADAVESKNKRERAAAIDSVLDRTGYGRKTTQDVRVEHVDNRSTAELLAEVRKLTGASLPVIEGEVVDVTPES